MSVKRFIQNHALLSFFILVIGWSHLFWQLLFTVMPLDPSKGLTVLHILFGGLGGSPSLIAILLVAIKDGRKGLGELVTNAIRWRVRFPCYLAALLLIPVLNLITYILFTLVIGRPYPITLSMFAFGIAGGLASSLLEEFGWRGYALPLLQKRWNAVASSLMLGLGWGIWHLGLNLRMVTADSSWLNLLVSAWGPLGLTAISLLMTWVYNHSQNSLLLMLIMHLSLTSSNFAFGIPADAHPSETLSFHLVALVVLWVAAGVVVLLMQAEKTRRTPQSDSLGGGRP